MHLKERPESLERALESAVSRALRDNLAPLQRTVDDLYQSYTDLVSACASTRPSNALPAMLRTQTAASSLAAGLSVLSNFVALALNPRDPESFAEQAGTAVSTSTVVELEEPPPVAAEPAANPDSQTIGAIPKANDGAVAGTNNGANAGLSVQPIAGTNGTLPRVEPAPVSAPEDIPVAAAAVSAAEDIPVAAAAVETLAVEPQPAAAEIPVFDIASYIASLPTELQDLHRRANRVAKVTMQDIKLLRPADVQTGRENKDICVRLRGELDKAHKEYERRFRAIQEHPVDYFHNWMVEILAGGDTTALGEYPYPSPVLRH